MLPAETMRGIWISEFEGSAFYPGMTDPQEALRRHVSKVGPDEAAWLELRTPSPLLPEQRRPLHIVALEFIGRRTRYDGAFGHMGFYGRSVIVDRIISAKVFE
jgi:hypothetical protein